MAIVKNNYVKPDGREKAKAKASIRYIEHRRGKDGAKITRTLFNGDGAVGRYEAYRMIDEAEKGSIFFRFIISPDAQTEDTRRDLHLREVTEKTMLSLEEQIKKQVQWVAAVHDDHTAIRHVHIVAIVPGRLPRQEFQALPQVLRVAATEASLAQRHERDLAREQKEQEQEKEEAQWERER
jgi:hypothetical protein